jgi:hypothetical protein
MARFDLPSATIRHTSVSRTDNNNERNPHPPALTQDSPTSTDHSLIDRFIYPTINCLIDVEVSLIVCCAGPQMRVPVLGSSILVSPAFLIFREAECSLHRKTLVAQIFEHDDPALRL